MHVDLLWTHEGGFVIEGHFRPLSPSDLNTCRQCSKYNFKHFFLNIHSVYSFFKPPSDWWYININSVSVLACVPVTLRLDALALVYATWVPWWKCIESNKLMSTCCLFWWIAVLVYVWKSDLRPFHSTLCLSAFLCCLFVFLPHKTFQTISLAGCVEAANWNGSQQIIYLYFSA